MSTPRASILVITYNQQDLVEQTLLSALEQDYDNLEVVVSDDHSQDSTPQVIRSLAGKYPDRLVPLLNPASAGITGNTNLGLRACTGDFIAFQGGDDLLLPGKISRQVQHLLAHPGMALSYHDVDVFDSGSGDRLYLWSQRYGRRTGGMASVIRYGTYMAGTSVMVRRSCLPEDGMDARIRTASDWLFWVHVLAQCNGRVGYIDRVLSRHRRHIENVTREWGWKFEDRNLTLAIIESRWPEYSPLVRQRRSEIFFTQAIHHLVCGNRQAAWRLASSAVLSALPAMPWLHLAVREILFYIRTRGRRDDIRASLFHSR